MILRTAACSPRKIDRDGYGIRVNAILPGAVEGERFENVLKGRANLSGNSVEEERSKALAVQSLQRLSMSNRASFSSGDWFEGTDAAYRSQGLSYISYSGPFDVDEHSGEHTHTIAVSMFPNWIGQVQPRTVKLAGDTLELRNTSQYRSLGRAVNARILWSRASRIHG